MTVSDQSVALESDVFEEIRNDRKSLGSNDSNTNATDEEKQEGLLNLITVLLKFNCFLSTTVATQCIFQSNL